MKGLIAGYRKFKPALKLQESSKLPLRPSCSFRKCLILLEPPQSEVETNDDFKHWAAEVPVVGALLPTALAWGWGNARKSRKASNLMNSICREKGEKGTSLLPWVLQCQKFHTSWHHLGMS